MQIKLIIFDLDGVLVNTHNIHVNALNMALQELAPEFVISEQQDKLFGTITTKNKLKILSEKGLSPALHNNIINLKNKYTYELLDKNNDIFNNKLHETLEYLSQDYTLYIASNTNKQFINTILNKFNLNKYFTKIYSNEDVEYNKPHPEIYLKSILEAKVSPFETIIFEDSITGQEAAIKSGSHWFFFPRSPYLYYNIIINKINNIKPK